MFVECEKATIYAIGYEGVTFERFIETLRQEEIEVIVDIRANPISRKPGFSKSALKKRLEEEGFEYAHYPQLGIPSKVRKEYSDIRELLNYYDRAILPNFTDVAEEVAHLCEQKAAALLCFEANASFCHRSRLARYICKNFDLSPKYIG